MITKSDDCKNGKTANVKCSGKGTDKKTYILITDGLFTLNNDRFDL